jgi:hypothetical protein
MSAPTPLEILRRYIDDEMPTDGTDPTFTDEELNDALSRSNNDPERAAVEGWRWKAARYTKLVDVTEGNASRAMSDMLGHALDMINHFERSRGGPTEGRTRIGTIRRRYV